MATRRRDGKPTPAAKIGLGARLRTEREGKEIGLRELARRVGVSPSLISQIETGKSDPSVSTLLAIAGELDLSPNEIVFGPKTPKAPVAAPGADAKRPRGRWPVEADDADASRGPVQRAATRKAINLEFGVRWERLTPAPDHEVDFLFVRYDVGAESTPANALMRHSGREYAYVISGRLLVAIGFEEYELGPGDSITFSASMPHRLATIGDEPAEAVWMVVGRRTAPDPAA